MNPGKRNRKNLRYLHNVESRDGATKATLRRETMSDGIIHSEEEDREYWLHTPGRWDYVTTRRHGVIVTQYKYTFTWTSYAAGVKAELHKYPYKLNKKEIKKLLESRKIHIIDDDKAKLNIKARTIAKAERLKALPFSKLHKTLVEGLYDNKQDRILKQQTEKAAHEQTIKTIMYTLHPVKMDTYNYETDTSKKESALKKQQISNTNINTEALAA